MDKKKLMLLLGALVIAIGTAMAARNLLAGGSAPKAEAAQQVPTGPKVLVAQRALPVGTIITADSISFQLWPKEMVQDAYFIDGEADMNKLLGTVVRYPITAGQPVTQGALVAPGDRGFLAAALGPGMRAITIPVSAKTGVGGFVFPGDHVDLMLTQTVRSTDSGDTLKATETILRNVRVLATDQSTETTVEDGKTVVRAFRTVTLEVTPKIAEKIAVAQTIGTLSLSLRSLADNAAELDQAIASGNVKVPAGANKQQEEKFLADAMNRPVDGGATFVTGGDVSRFQRRSLPPPPPSPAMRGNYAAPVAGSTTTTVVRQGPVVRVTRGKTTVEEPVGGR
ncbi:Flp pilus assembly protein CpaB [Novosphingobium sp.]|uniref:Flp pilus assembly protein CpaB n=1 Tax=Novosphingobium sp. TaxID=1874826 RepID=UPI0035B04563